MKQNPAALQRWAVTKSFRTFSSLIQIVHLIVVVHVLGLRIETQLLDDVDKWFTNNYDKTLLVWSEWFRLPDGFILQRRILSSVSTIVINSNELFFNF